MNAIVSELTTQAPALRSAGKKAKVIIATDGEPSDGNLALAMAPLKNLPVIVVIRLCTSEDKIVDYWNGVDKDLELNMDIIDDLNSEAEGVTELNPWLYYSEPIQRFREAGSQLREIDLLDEAKLSADQIRNFCILL
jgi:hypothetical protein